MALVSIPYAEGSLEIEIPDKNFLGVLTPPKAREIGDLNLAVREALARPVGSKRLREMVWPQAKIAVVIPDLTRPCPDKVFVPLILEEIEAGGGKLEHVVIIIGTGMHRALTSEEIIEKVGVDVAKNIKVVNHSAQHEAQLIYLGETSYGCPVWVNKHVAEADLVVSTGVIEPHLFAGYSGGRKAIAIGVTGERTIEWQHRWEILEDPNTRIGNVYENIFHKNATEIAKMAGLSFVLNAVLNNEGKIAEIVAGSPEAAFEEGVKYADKIYKVRITEQADIAITGVGYPKDVNIYQATRGASYIAFSPYPSVRKGGLIIVPARTEEGAGRGTGEERFFQLMASVTSPKKLIEKVKKEGYPAGGQRAYLMALTMEHAEVVIVSSATPEVVRKMHMQHFDTIDEAIRYGLQRFGDDAKIWVIPHSMQVITVKG